MKIILKKSELIEVAKALGVRPDWHEPDEQDVTVKCLGSSFDNAGFWGPRCREYAEQKGVSFLMEAECSVLIFKGSDPVAEVNLATLFAWATGLEA